MTDKPPHVQKKLGDILEDCRVVTSEQVDQALMEQRRSGKLFGEALLDLGFVSEDDLGWALSAQLSVPYIDINSDMVDRQTMRDLGDDLMRRHQILPLVRVGDALTIVVADPTNPAVVHDVESATHLTVQTSIASPRKIKRILDEILGPVDISDDETSDLLFREMTRPQISAGNGESERMNPVGALFSTALRQKVREIHFEPNGKTVRVRFRRDSGLEDQPGIRPRDFEDVVGRLRDKLSLGNPSSGMSRWSSVVRFADGSLGLSVSVLDGPDGQSMIVELREPDHTDSTLADLGLDDSMTSRLREVLAGDSGLLIVAGPDGLGPQTLLEALIREIDTDSRCVVAAASSLDLPRSGVFRVHDSQAGDVMSSPFADVVIVESMRPGPQFDWAIEAAACGTLVIGHLMSPDAVACLARLAGHGNSRISASRALRGIVETCVRAPGKMSARLLTMTPAVRRAFDAGSDLTTLDEVARKDGFESLFSSPGTDSDDTSDGPDSGRKAA